MDTDVRVKVVSPSPPPGLPHFILPDFTVREDDFQRFFVPGGLLPPTLRASLEAASALEQSERHPAKNAEVRWRVVQTRRTLIFFETHVHRPVELVLDAPMMARRLSKQTHLTWLAEVHALTKQRGL